MKPHIPTPCTENWDKMKIGLYSRHCESCKKDVMDFTKMSREEILTYLIENRNKEVCGRVIPSQLDFHRKEVLITIKELMADPRNKNKYFLLLSLATLTLLGCENDPQSTSNSPFNNLDSIVELSMVASDTLNIEGNSVSPDTINQERQQLFVNHDSHSSIVCGSSESYVTSGFVVMDYDKMEDPLAPKLFVDIMPEFVGGEDSLFEFFKKNIKYPKLEKKQNIEGTVYVSFIVNKEGKAVHPKIEKTVKGSENFDKEVLRVIDLMPPWKPGKDKLEVVDVRYYLPVKFSLR